MAVRCSNIRKKQNSISEMGIIFYLFFVGAGLAAALLITKALKAIKLI